MGPGNVWGSTGSPKSGIMLILFLFGLVEAKNLPILFLGEESKAQHNIFDIYGF